MYKAAAAGIVLAAAVLAGPALANEKADHLISYQCSSAVDTFQIETREERGRVWASGFCSRESDGSDSSCHYECDIEFFNFSSDCAARVNGTFRFGGDAVKFIDWGAGIKIEPGDSVETTGDVRYTIEEYGLEELVFEMDTYLFECE